MKNHQKFGLDLVCLAVLITTTTIAVADSLSFNQDPQSQITPSGNQGERK
jgi:hypothetical protein